METKKAASEEAEKKTESETPMEVSAPTPASGNVGGSSDLVVGEDYNHMVQNIMDMGYGRDEVSLFFSFFFYTN